MKGRSSARASPEASVASRAYAWGYGLSLFLGLAARVWTPLYMLVMLPIAAEIVMASVGTTKKE